MSHDEHTPFRENIPAYALDALDARDAAALESHLQTCASCRTELAGYRAVSDRLLTALPPQNPPAALRRRLQARLPGAQKAQRPRLNWSIGRVAMATAFVLLLALNVYSVLQVPFLFLHSCCYGSRNIVGLFQIRDVCRNDVFRQLNLSDFLGESMFQTGTIGCEQPDASLREFFLSLSSRDVRD